MRQDTRTPGNPRQQTWAIVSLILGILVFCTMGLTGPFAIWAGITSNRKREGSGMATAGIVLGGVGSMILAAFIGLPLLSLAYKATVFN